MQNIYEVQEANKRKSLLVIILFVVFVTAAVYFISQAFGIYLGYEFTDQGYGTEAIILLIQYYFEKMKEIYLNY